MWITLISLFTSIASAYVGLNNILIKIYKWHKYYGNAWVNWRSDNIQLQTLSTGH